MTKPVKNEQLDEFRYFGSILAEIEQQVHDADYEETLKPFLKTLEGTHTRGFTEQRDPAGSPWKKLAPSTIKRKGHDIILFETGRLESSLEGKTADSIREVTHRGLLFGTEVPYAIFHQEGEGVPKRQHVGMNEEMTDKIVDAVADQTVEVMKPI